MICIKPIAPLGEMACTAPKLSARMTARIQAAEALRNFGDERAEGHIVSRAMRWTASDCATHEDSTKKFELSFASANALSPLGAVYSALEHAVTSG